MDPQPLFINEESKCEELLEKALDAEIVAVDVESDSMHVYFERLALMQIKISDQVYLVDTLNIGIPEPLRKILVSNSIVKVFQDMKFDLQLFKKEYDIDVVNVFDISIADKIVQLTNQSSSMEKLIKNYLGMELKFSKKQQKSNWGVRPLSEKQMCYASEDVRYLIPIMNILEEKLDDDYRLDLFYNFMEYLKPISRERYYNVNYAYKLANKYQIKEETVLTRVYQILNQLDELSQYLNKPSHWLLHDQTLVEIARSNPSSQEEFNKQFYKNDGLQQYRKTISSSLYLALEIDEIIPLEPPQNTNLRRWLYIENQEKRILSRTVKHDEKQIINSWRSVVARELKIIPEMVLNRTDISFACSVIDEDEPSIIFPSIPKNLYSLFWQDLQEYYKSSISKINGEIFRVQL